jgi:electron transfer flavoprotein alpha subunit
MRVLVCVKGVHKGENVSFDTNRQTLVRARGSQTLNPADCVALERAFRLIQRCGGDVTVLSLGPPSMEYLLQELCALPVNQAILLTDPAYAGSDTLATAGILASAVRRLGNFDIILLGNKAIDGETGHVGPELAALLNISSCVTNVRGDISVEDGHILCTRLLEGSTQALRAPLPCLLTVCGGGIALRPASLAGIRGAKPVRVLTNTDLCLPLQEVGLRGSPTIVVKTRQTREGQRNARIIRDAAEGARAMLEAIRQTTRPHTKIRNVSHVSAADVSLWVVSLEDDAPGRQAAVILASATRDMGACPKLVRLLGQDDAACARGLANLARNEKPNVILLPATIRGRSVAPYCAALLRTGLSADCTDLAWEEGGRLLQIRPAFGGSLLSEIRTRASPQMATIRPGVFPCSGDCLDAEEILVDTGHTDGVSILASSPLESAGLNEARIIMAGGKGMGGKNGFERLERFAASMGASVGASRSAVVAGYAAYDMQIGQTGVTVSPDVYVAFAVSGAAQHVAGMRRSGTVVAVNTDLRAPMFLYSDIAIVAPWESVLQEAERLLGAEILRTNPRETKTPNFLRNPD